MQADATAHHGVITAADVARLAGVGRAAVGNWRRRYDDFPQPVSGTDSSPSFRLSDVHAWLRATGRLGPHSLVELAWQALEASVSSGSLAQAVAEVGTYLASDKASSELDATVRAAVDDLVADAGAPAAFGQLCTRYLDAASRQLAATPSNLAVLMIELAEIHDGPVLDPACGTGSLLLAVPGTVAVLGQELDPGLATLARARLTLTHEAARVEVGDALRTDRFADLRAAAVVCEPPFNERAWGYEELQYDHRWVYGLPPRGESELAWVQHCLAHVRPGGRAVVVLPPGVAVRRSGRPIRAALLRRGALRAIISLPPGAVAPAHLPMQLWVLGVDDRDPAEGVRMVDTTRGSRARIDELGWMEIARRVRSAMAGDDDPALQRWVPTIDLLDDDVDLTPARHLGTDLDVQDIQADRDRFVELLGRLGGLLPPLGARVDQPERPRTTVGELARQGALTILHQTGSMEVGEGPGVPVLTSGDVVAGRGPSGFTLHGVAGVRLQAGDVVVPAVAARPTALVVEQGCDALLGPGLRVLRPAPEQLDPWFLAGVLRSAETTRTATTTSGSYRIDVRRVELPRLPLPEQRRLGEVVRALDRFGAAVDDAAEVGRRLVRTATDALVGGRLQPEEGKKSI